MIQCHVETTKKAHFLSLPYKCKDDSGSHYIFKSSDDVLKYISGVFICNLKALCSTLVFINGRRWMDGMIVIKTD